MRTYRSWWCMNDLVARQRIRALVRRPAPSIMGLSHTRMLTQKCGLWTLPHHNVHILQDHFFSDPDGWWEEQVVRDSRAQLVAVNRVPRVSPDPMGALGWHTPYKLRQRQ